MQAEIILQSYMIRNNYPCIYMSEDISVSSFILRNASFSVQFTLFYVLTFGQGMFRGWKGEYALHPELNLPACSDPGEQMTMLRVG